jgi:hypothetical protein
MRRIWERTRAALIKKRHSLDEASGGVAWKAKASEYDKQFDNNRAAWRKEYGQYPEARQYERIDEGSQLYAEADKRLAGTTDGLAIMRYIQSPAHSQIERKVYYDIFKGIQIAGLGPQLVANYERRNAKMADFVEQEINARKSSRVLVIVGSGHRLFLEDEFRRRGYRLVAGSDLLKGGMTTRAHQTDAPDGSTKLLMTKMAVLAASTSR